MDDVLQLDATAQAQLIRDGKISPRELTEASIARIEALDPEFNAVVHRRFDRALAEAAAVSGDGPFSGVPTLLKDLGWLSEGDVYTEGSRVLRGFVCPWDAYATSRLKRAGFVILGRTNVPEFGTSSTTEPTRHGATRNPWHRDYSPGGSSGGSAAAVAAGMVAMATANDGGGSIRIPASLCGLVGLKPSRGRISLGPGVGEAWAGLGASGVLTRTVRDTAATLDLLSGLMPGDPYTAPPLPGPLAEEVGRPPGRLRVGFTAGHLRDDVPEYPDGAAAVRRAASLLESLGHEVAESSPASLADPSFPDHLGTVVSVNTAAWVDQLGRLRGGAVDLDELEAMNKAMVVAARKGTAVDYVGRLGWLDAYRGRVIQWWDSRDLLLTPTLGTAPYRLGWLTDPDFRVLMSRLNLTMAFTAPFNVTGQPAISLPMGRTADGVPVGVQLVAAPGREDILVRVAAQIEEASPWTVSTG
ncbi:amidase [Rhizohabitans arisaemae]|uniref:amidase n=1 Tax=Rhizohabitans arisaemae TaxID=2720610 RepID=UPI0024B08375|nr:amidase [Rhizohabitans arisaemae]